MKNTLCLLSLALLIPLSLSAEPVMKEDKSNEQAPASGPRSTEGSGPVDPNIGTRVRGKEAGGFDAHERKAGRVHYGGSSSSSSSEKPTVKATVGIPAGAVD